MASSCCPSHTGATRGGVGVGHVAFPGVRAERPQAAGFVVQWPDQHFSYQKEQKEQKGSLVQLAGREPKCLGESVLIRFLESRPISLVIWITGLGGYEATTQMTLLDADDLFLGLQCCLPSSVQ
jgi:hypothetical protein